MNLTRKHFMEFAAELRLTRPGSSLDEDRDRRKNPTLQQWRDDRDAVASALKRIAPNFDRARFVTATEE